MFIALRRFTLVATLILERTIDKKRHDRMTYTTIAVMLSGKSLSHLLELGCHTTGPQQTVPHSIFGPLLGVHVVCDHQKPLALSYRLSHSLSAFMKSAVSGMSDDESSNELQNQV